MSTRFFERQDTARSNTLWLGVLFLVAVIGLIGVTSGAGYFIASMMGNAAVVQRRPSPRPGDVELDPVGAAVIFGAAAAVVIVVGSLYQIMVLRLGGGTRVAESVGGRQLRGDVTDLGERRLMNIVEEMAIASGTPVPPVYVLEEQAINAFAAGYLPGDAVIGVTRGAIEKLTRDELQGVIAHEFSHIFNGDMRMNIRMIGVLHGILLLGLIGHMMLRSVYYSGGSRRSDGRLVALLAVGGSALIIVGAVGSFFGGLIKAAVSRQREYLADASAVQFTRNPEGIGGALKRIGGFARQGRLEHPNAGMASHMYFAQGVFEGLTGMLATHPPLPARIRAIDPTWDGTFPEPPRELPYAGSGSRRPQAATGFAGDDAAAPQRMSPPGGAPRRQHARSQAPFSLPEVVAAVDQVGAPQQEHHDYSAGLLHEIDPVLVDAAHEAYSARALVLALLLDDDAQMRSAQLSALHHLISADVVALTVKLYPKLAAMPDAARLPLVDLALPMLRMMTAPQYATFSRALQAMIDADKRLSIFEWTLSQVLIRHLRSQYAPAAPKPVTYYRLTKLNREVSLLLSILAHVGHSGGEAEAAFNAAASELPDLKLQLLPPSECSFAKLDVALDKLARSSAQRRGELLAACAASVSADGVVKVKEAELVRGIADLLNCPMPPLAGSLEPNI